MCGEKAPVHQPTNRKKVKHSVVQNTDTVMMEKSIEQMEAASDHTKKDVLEGASSESELKRKSVGRNVGRPKMENNFGEVILDGGVKCWPTNFDITLNEWVGHHQ